MTYHGKTAPGSGRKDTKHESGLVRSSGGTSPSDDAPGTLVGQTIIPDPVPPSAPSGLVSTAEAPKGTGEAVASALPGLEPVPGYVPRPDLFPERESEGIEECRPMPADCHARTSEQEEFILVRRCGWQRRRRPNRSMDRGLERARLFGRGSRTRGFLKRLGDRLSDNGVGRGGILGDVLGSLEAAPSGGTLEVVIDIDDRTLIEDTTVAPHSGSAQLEIVLHDGRGYIGTASLIAMTQSASVFLTAAHCVHYPEGGGFAKKVTISPGRNGDEFPYGRYEINPGEGIGEILVPQGWIDSSERTQDYALLIVPERVQGHDGAVPHVFSYAALSDAQIANTLANITGYPIDLNVPLMVGELQFFHAERITAIEEKMLAYQTDTTGGQSGAAVFRTDTGTGERCLIAIHTMGDLGGNSATRLTAEIAAQIDAVIASVS